LYWAYFAITKVDPTGNCCDDKDLDSNCPKRDTTLIANYVASGSRVTATSDPPVVGKCGQFQWDIHWKLVVPSGASGGYVMQYIWKYLHIEKCDGTVLFSQPGDDFWEAWPINPNADKLNPDTDRYSEGFKGCSRGFLIVLGSFGYVDGPAPSPPFDVGGCQGAGNAPCTSIDPGIESTEGGSHFVISTWDCCCPEC